jgi:hypothetical protein
MEGYVPVATYATEIDAQLAQATLASAEIESIVKSEDVGQMLPFLQQIRGVKLLVDPAFLEEARRILNGPVSDPPDQPDAV